MYKEGIRTSLQCHGEMIMYGVGQAADYAKAKSLFEEACKAKDGFGCYRLGTLSENGWGVEGDISFKRRQPTMWGVMPVTLRHVWTLVRCTKDRIGVARNYERALGFYKKPVKKTKW